VTDLIASANQSLKNLRFQSHPRLFPIDLNVAGPRDADAVTR
jgi:hypothetical protein